MASDESSPKIGAGHASAMFRQGLSELRGSLYSDSNVAQPPQYGLYGTKTPGEVAEARQADAQLDEEKGSILESRMREAESSREEPALDDKSMDRD